MSWALMDTTRSLLRGAPMPYHWWGDALLHSASLRKRTKTHCLCIKTPFELLYGKPPRKHHIRMLGCPGYVYPDKEIRKSEFEYTYTLGMYVGLRNGHHHVCMTGNNALVTTRRLLIYETFSRWHIMEISAMEYSRFKGWWTKRLMARALLMSKWNSLENIILVPTKALVIPE